MTKANKMTCAPSEDSDQPWHQPSLISLCWVLLGKLGDLSFLQVNSKDSDQTEQMHRLIWVFAAHKGHFAGFVMWWLSYFQIILQRVVVPDQLPCFVVSYLGFHALPKSVGLNARLKWVKFCWILDQFDVVEPKWAATWQNQESECAPSEDSDQPGHQPSLISVFAMHLMCS